MTTVVKERPIIFTGENVRKILDGKKTQTRRIVKNAHIITADDLTGVIDTPCPYGKPGERLYVKEGFRFYYDQNLYDCIEYRIDRAKMKPSGLTEEIGFPFSEKCGIDSRWKSPLFMPRWASRLTLEITDVRVERLWYISGEDVIAEGVQCLPREGTVTWESETRTRMAKSWNGVHGAGAWEQGNPWVWAITFKVVSPAAKEAR